MTETRTRNLVALGIFVITAALLLIFHSNRLVATNDEGLILEPAQRMLGGARPYVDFFGYMTPGSYWLQTLVFRIFGISFWAGRLIVILDFSVQCALVFWIAARIASLRAATAACLAFAGFQIADPSALTSTHRWDSATLALAGIAVILGNLKWRYAASGALLAAAAWCTPALAIVAAAVLITARNRRNLLLFAGGVLAITLPAALALAATGSFVPFLRQLAWLRTNYSQVNVMAYGSIIGGYHALFEGASGGADLAIRSVLVACVALPAIAPIVAIILTAVLRSRTGGEERRNLDLVLLATAGFAITVFPRSDVAHLLFVAALPFALCAVGIARLLPARAGAAIAMSMVLLAGIFGSNFFKTLSDTVPVVSPVGILRVPRNDAASAARIFNSVRLGSTLFIYPYMPIHYFTTQTANPTRFSFLAAGMMTDREGAIALAELRQHPPQSLLYMKLTHDEFMRVFPNAAQVSWRFNDIEDWLEANYEPDGNDPPYLRGYTLWRHCQDLHHCRASDILQARQQ